METDSFFYQLLKQVPQTLFELLGLPSDRCREYRFDAVEVKKSLRIDGLFRPIRPDLPLYFVEVQQQPLATFYANLFAKVFCFLDENDPGQDWNAVAILKSRRVEPKHLTPYRELLESERVVRVYLDEYPMPADPPVGLSLLQLLLAPVEEAKRQVVRLRDKIERENVGRDFAAEVIELIEGLLLRRFPDLNREEIRTMFQLHDIRKSKVWQEAHETGIEVGIEAGIEKNQREMVARCISKGMPAKEISDLLGIAIKEVRRIAREMQP